VIANTWCEICRIHILGFIQLYTRAILHDSVMYPEPDVFKPERFINPNGTLREDPELAAAFGFGKRICPGRHLADATLFIAIASLLSVFDITKRSGTDGGPDMYPFKGHGVWYGHHILVLGGRDW
jgi:cytochrome P450